jgi:HD-GYP domain-containing protein (c-di-GMP phosphodiesterase class II)
VLIVPIEEARAGMALAVNVTHPEQPDQDLLKAGFVLNDDILGRLRDIGVDTIYVDYPDLADLDHHLGPFLSPARALIYKQVRDTIAAVQKTAQPTVSFPDYYAATRDLILTLMQHGQNVLYLDHMSGRMGANAVAHATSVAHLSLMLGLRLETYLIQQRSRLNASHAREVVNLGVAGMLHDIGLAALPEPLRKSSRVDVPQDEASLAEWRTHPERGYDMVRGGIEASAASAVLHHHQHFDGSGFPAMAPNSAGELRNAGTRIHVFARILTIADLYDRLTVGEEGRRRPNVEILHLMRTKYASWLDPEILPILPSVIPPFPPGMKVALNDGSDAVTVGLSPDEPYRPVVRRIVDGDTLELSKEAVDLSETDELSITSIAGVSVEALVPPPPPLAGEPKSLSLAGQAALAV